jgi:hypothetical protein
LGSERESDAQQRALDIHVDKDIFCIIFETQVEEAIAEIKPGVDFPHFEVVIELAGHQVRVIHMVHAETTVIALQEQIPIVVKLDAGLKANHGGIGSEFFAGCKAVSNEAGFNFKRYIVPKIPEPGRSISLPSM